MFQNKHFRVDAVATEQEALVLKIQKTRSNLPPTPGAVSFTSPQDVKTVCSACERYKKQIADLQTDNEKLREETMLSKATAETRAKENQRLLQNLASKKETPLSSSPPAAHLSEKYKEEILHWKEKEQELCHQKKLLENEKLILERRIANLNHTVESLQKQAQLSAQKREALESKVQTVQNELSGAKYGQQRQQEQTIQEKSRREEIERLFNDYRTEASARQQSHCTAIREAEVRFQKKMSEHHAEMLTLSQKLAASQAKENLYEGAFEREQSRTAAVATSARIGEEGERWAFETLQEIIGDHAEIKDTSAFPGQGDIQITWHPPGSSHFVLVVVESKHTEQQQRLMPRAYISQTHKEIATTNAHAGIILYSGPISAEFRTEVQAAERLVIVGCCRDSGQMVSGLAMALTLGYINLMAEEAGKSNELVTKQDAEAVSATVEAYAKMVGSARSALYDVTRFCNKSLSTQKAMCVESKHAHAQVRPQIAARLFPTTFTDEVLMPYEKISNSNVTNAANNNKNKKLPLYSTSSLTATTDNTPTAADHTKADATTTNTAATFLVKRKRTKFE